MTRVGLPRPVLRLQVLLCLAPPRLASSCRVLSCCVLSLVVASGLLLSCLALPCVFVALPCVVLLVVLEYKQTAICLCCQILCYRCFLRRNVAAYCC